VTGEVTSPPPPEGTSSELVVVDTTASIDWSYDGADEKRDWVGMHGWYY
jgi:hypothetical protein